MAQRTSQYRFVYLQYGDKWFPGYDYENMLTEDIYNVVLEKTRKGGPDPVSVCPARGGFLARCRRLNSDVADLFIGNYYAEHGAAGCEEKHFMKLK